MYIIYMIGNEDGYDDDDDGDDVMIISPSSSLEGRVRMMYIYDDYFSESLYPIILIIYFNL